MVIELAFMVEAIHFIRVHSMAGLSKTAFMDG